MAISYPLSLPTTPGFESLEPRLVNINGMTRSTFTGQRQVTQWPGEWIEFHATLPPMLRATAEPWLAFQAALRGVVGTFLLGPEKQARTAQGTPSGATVNGSGQTGTTLTLAGSGSFVAGDWIQLSSGATSRLHKILFSGSVAGTHEIFPRLRESPTNGSAVVVSSPKGLFHLAEDTRDWSIPRDRFYYIQFRAVEFF